MKTRMTSDTRIGTGAFAVSLAVACISVTVEAKWYVDIRTNPVVQVEVEAVPGKAKSLLPPGKNWKLAWHDEFETCGK